MTKLFICGHGAGDPGACAGGDTEANLVRILGEAIQNNCAEDIVFFDPDHNCYKEQWLLHANLDLYDEITELHMDSYVKESSHGGHVEIWHKFKPDTHDKALAEVISKHFPGRSESIVPRNDLFNMHTCANRHKTYRLLELGFITNTRDRDYFKMNLTSIARDIITALGMKCTKETPEGGYESVSDKDRKLRKIIDDLTQWRLDYLS